MAKSSYENAISAKVSPGRYFATPRNSPQFGKIFTIYAKNVEEMKDIIEYAIRIHFERDANGISLEDAKNANANIQYEIPVPETGNMVYYTIDHLNGTYISDYPKRLEYMKLYWEQGPLDNIYWREPPISGGAPLTGPTPIPQPTPTRDILSQEEIDALPNLKLTSDKSKKVLILAPQNSTPKEDIDVFGRYHEYNPELNDGFEIGTKEDCDLILEDIGIKDKEMVIIVFVEDTNQFVIVNLGIVPVTIWQFGERIQSIIMKAKESRVIKPYDMIEIDRYKFIVYVYETENKQIPTEDEYERRKEIKLKLVK